MSGSAWTRPQLAIYGHWLTAGHGVLSLAHVVTGDVEQHAERRERFEKTLRAFIAREELQAFPAVVVSQYLSDGIEALVQCHGIGGMRPNTVLFGWPGNADKAGSFGSQLRIISRMGRSVVAVRLNQDAGDSEQPSDPWTVPQGTIDVWWRGSRNGKLMLLLAHLLHQNPEWRRNPIRMLRVVEKTEAETDVRSHIEQLAGAARIRVTPEVVVSSNPAQAIQQTSADAAVVILGFEVPEEGDEPAFHERMNSLAGGLPTVLFVSSAGGVELES